MQKIKLMIAYVGILLFITSAAMGCNASESPTVSHKDNIKKFLILLEKNPDNCFYMEQVASNYQALKEFGKAIYHYEKVVKSCPKDFFSLFQLGICHFLLGDRNLGIFFMDKAIERTYNSGDTEMLQILRKEKKAWLGKWDAVEDLRLNNKK